MQDRIFSATKLVAATPARAIAVHLKNSVGKINIIEAGMNINKEYPERHHNCTKGVDMPK